MAINIPYDLWPIWCDYLEEQGQNTELLRLCMEYGVFNNTLANVTVRYYDTYGAYLYPPSDKQGISTTETIFNGLIPYENAMSRASIWLAIYAAIGNGTRSYCRF